jgi:hypothetical protein
MYAMRDALRDECGMHSDVRRHCAGYAGVKKRRKCGAYRDKTVYMGV